MSIGKKALLTDGKKWQWVISFIIIAPFHLWSDYFKGACLGLRWPRESVQFPHCVNIQDIHTYLPLKRRKHTQIFKETGTVWLAWRAEGWHGFHFSCVDTPGRVMEWGHRWHWRGLSGAHRPLLKEPLTSWKVNWLCTIRPVLAFPSKWSGAIPSKGKLWNPNLSNLVPRQKSVFPIKKGHTKLSQILFKVLWMCNLKYFLSTSLIFLCLTPEEINQS